jgi:alpha-galactosidase
VWFEPERVAKGYWLAENRPEWVLGGKNGGLLNLGIPECRAWLTNHIDKIITEQGIDLYRQDFNIDPLGFWRKNDAPDRQGITEIRHVEGYFAYWDELKKRHKGMLIDSCASGGRRNDVETLRRAVPLLRSDYIFEPIGEQGHTYGMSFWVPFNGTGFMTFDKYLMRSVLGPEFTMGVDTRKTDADYPMFRRVFEEWKRVSPCFMGDYYPLTPYSLAKNAWIGWQFDLPEEGQGMVEVFRREECADEAITVKLCGLDAQVNYLVESLDTTRTDEASGQELMETGLRLSVPERPGSALIAYKKAK